MIVTMVLVMMIQLFQLMMMILVKKTGICKQELLYSLWRWWKKKNVNTGSIMPKSLIKLFAKMWTSSRVFGNLLIKLFGAILPPIGFASSCRNSPFDADYKVLIHRFCQCRHCRLKICSYFGWIWQSWQCWYGETLVKADYIFVAGQKSK